MSVSTKLSTRRVVQVSVRLSPALHRELKAAAKSDARSMQGEITVAIQQFLKGREAG